MNSGRQIETNLDIYFQYAIRSLEQAYVGDQSPHLAATNHYKDIKKNILSIIEILNDVSNYSPKIISLEDAMHHSIVHALTNIAEISYKHIIPHDKMNELRKEIRLAYCQLTGIPSTIDNGDELRNINSYEYLRNFAAVPLLDYDLSLNTNVSNVILATVLNVTQYKYNNAYPYGDLYTKLMLALENIIFSSNVIHPFIQDIIQRVYQNDNLALLRSYETVKEILEKTNQTSHECENEVRKKLEIKNTSQINVITGRDLDGYWNKLWEKVTPTDVRPQNATSIPSFRQYQYQSNEMPREIRMGTQGIYTNGEVAINPLFLEWRKNAKQLSAATFSHIYFNLLPLDRPNPNDSFLNKHYYSPTSRNTYSEVQIAHKLHTIDERQYGIAIITLPSSQGLLDINRTKSAEKVSYRKAFNEMLNVACGASQLSIRDFCISNTVKQSLYKDQHHERIILGTLLQKSFEVFSFTPNDKLNGEEQQIVYFHFIKYRVPKFIIETLHPSTFNFSCWDGMDRAGIESLYFNLMRSLEENKPLNRVEFEIGLHGAPVMIKERSMNNQIKLLWSVFNFHISRQAECASQIYVLPIWLKEWCEDNKPGNMNGNTRNNIAEENLKIHLALLKATNATLNNYDNHTGVRGLFQNAWQGEKSCLLELRNYYKDLQTTTDINKMTNFANFLKLKQIVKSKDETCSERNPPSLLDRSFHTLTSELKLIEKEFQPIKKALIPHNYNTNTSIYTTQAFFAKLLNLNQDFPREASCIIDRSLDKRDIDSMKCTMKFK